MTLVNNLYPPPHTQISDKILNRICDFHENSHECDWDVRIPAEYHAWIDWMFAFAMFMLLCVDVMVMLSA